MRFSDALRLAATFNISDRMTVNNVKSCVIAPIEKEVEALRPHYPEIHANESALGSLLGSQYYYSCRAEVAKARLQVASESMSNKEEYTHACT